jgi:hypothetical protein
MTRWLVALAAFFSAAVQAMPLEITAEYRLASAGVTIGRVSESFQRNGERYSIRSITRADGALKLVVDDNVTLESRGRVGPAGLVPLEFEQRRAGNASKDVFASFDWERGVMRSRFRGESQDVPLPGSTLYRLSILYQFMNIQKAGGRVEMHMSNGRKVERYSYRFVEEVRINTPAGDFETLHYARVTANEKEARTDVWIAKDRFNLPVRVVFDDPRGLRLEQTLLDLKVR